MQSEMAESLSSFHSRVTGKDRVTITPLRELYAHFEYRDLSAHGGRYNNSCTVGDPDDEFSESSVLSWVLLADFYQWPHVKTFDTWYELFSQLHTLLFEDTGRHGLMNISASMGVFARQQEAATRMKWADILDRVRRHCHSSSSLSSQSSSSSSSSSCERDLRVITKIYRNIYRNIYLSIY